MSTPSRSTYSVGCFSNVSLKIIGGHDSLKRILMLVLALEAMWTRTEIRKSEKNGVGGMRTMFSQRPSQMKAEFMAVSHVVQSPHVYHVTNKERDIRSMNDTEYNRHPIGAVSTRRATLDNCIICQENLKKGRLKIRRGTYCVGRLIADTLRERRAHAHHCHVPVHHWDDSGDGVSIHPMVSTGYTQLGSQAPVQSSE
ncbi:unnamed protein product, partial [Nesidiocoris tenuis]